MKVLVGIHPSKPHGLPDRVTTEFFQTLRCEKLILNDTLISTLIKGTGEKAHLGNVEAMQADPLLDPTKKFLRTLTNIDVPSSPLCLRAPTSLEIINAYKMLRAISTSISQHEKSKEEGASESVNLVEEQGRRSGVVIRDLTTRSRTLTSVSCGTLHMHCRFNPSR